MQSFKELWSFSLSAPHIMKFQVVSLHGRWELVCCVKGGTTTIYPVTLQKLCSCPMGVMEVIFWGTVMKDQAASLCLSGQSLTWTLLCTGSNITTFTEDWKLIPKVAVQFWSGIWNCFDHMLYFAAWVEAHVLFCAVVCWRGCLQTVVWRCWISLETQWKAVERVTGTGTGTGHY